MSDLDSLVLRNRIKVARAIKDWTQEDLGKQVGVARQTIALIEGGKCEPGTLLAKKLSIVLDYKFDDLFYIEEEIKNGQTTEPR